MRLLTHEVVQAIQAIPALYSTEESPEPTNAVVKFFTPWSSWTWYVVEGGTRHPDGCGFGENCDHQDLSHWRPGDDALFFGLVVGADEEFGYFTLHELEQLRGPGGLRVERDLYWSPRPVSEVQR